MSETMGHQFHLRARLQIALYRHGWAWGVAGLLALTSAALHVLLVGPTVRQIAWVHAQTAQALAQPKAIPSTPEQDDARELQKIQSVLASTSTAPQMLLTLAELASNQRITLGQAEYRTELHRSGLTRLVVTQPVRTSYPQAKRYIQSVLRAMPNTSLDHINARRDSVSKDQIEVTLRWSFWLVDDDAGTMPKARKDVST